MIARAGQLGAVTISTNMAGRGTDIQLGPGVAELGGLHVIGTNRHESRRIDNQLRGRAGRQGDPGSSEFFVSLGGRSAGEVWRRTDEDIESIQRIAEGQNLEIRRFLQKYESVIEGQRQKIQQRRQAILTGETPSLPNWNGWFRCAPSTICGPIIWPPSPICAKASSGFPGAAATRCTSI